MYNCSGRGVRGQIIVRHRGCRQPTRFVVADYYRSLNTLPSYIVSFVKLLSHQPFLAFIKFINGAVAYNVLPLGLTVGSFFNSYLLRLHMRYQKSVGSLVLLGFLKQNDTIYNGYFSNKTRFFFARAAGTFCKLRYLTQSRDFFVVHIPSGERKKLAVTACVFIGRNSNIYHYKEYLGSSGVVRKAGIRPTVRGVAMNPVDHPHGGRTKTNQPEVSP